MFFVHLRLKWQNVKFKKTLIWFDRLNWNAAKNLAKKKLSDVDFQVFTTILKIYGKKYVHFLSLMFVFFQFKKSLNHRDKNCAFRSFRKVFLNLILFSWYNILVYSQNLYEDFCLFWWRHFSFYYYLRFLWISSLGFLFTL